MKIINIYRTFNGVVDKIKEFIDGLEVPKL